MARFFRILFAPIFWLGRVCLWILFFPLGFWRSLRHSQKKRDRKLYAEMRRNAAQD